MTDFLYKILQMFIFDLYYFLDLGRWSHVIMPLCAISLGTIPAQYCQHQTCPGPVLAHNGMITGRYHAQYHALMC